MSDNFNFFFRKSSIRLICDMDSEIRRLEEQNKVLEESLECSVSSVMDVLLHVKEIHELKEALEEKAVENINLQEFICRREVLDKSNILLIDTLLKEIEALKQANLVLKDQLTTKENTH